MPLKLESSHGMMGILDGFEARCNRLVLSDVEAFSAFRRRARLPPEPDRRDRWMQLLVQTSGNLTTLSA